MITVHRAIQTRLKADTAATVSLQALLGSSGRILHAMEANIPLVPSITFAELTETPGSIDADGATSYDAIYVFRIFSNKCWEIKERLRQVLHQYTFPATSESGALRCVWHSAGPDLFDEDLKVARKDVQFRIFIVPKATAQI